MFVLFIFSTLASVATTSATSRSTKSLEFSSDGLPETAGGPPAGDAFLDLSHSAAVRKTLLARLSKAEALTEIERQAVGAQEQVLRALQQEQEALESKLDLMEASSRTLSSDGVVVEKATMSNSAEKTSLVQRRAQPEHAQLHKVSAKSAQKVVSAGDHAAKNVNEVSGAASGSKQTASEFMLMIRSLRSAANQERQPMGPTGERAATEQEEQYLMQSLMKSFWQKIAGIAVYLVQIFIVAILYMQFCKQSNIPKLPESQVRTEEFQFGAFDASDFMRDCQMCLCALCCPWVRWADTASAPHVSFLTFFPALFITALLASAGAITFGLSIPILLLVVVIGRQRIREAYGLPSGTCGELAGDCLLWIFCPCCAIVQEARQVEYVEIPMQEYGP